MTSDEIRESAIKSAIWRIAQLRRGEVLESFEVRSVGCKVLVSIVLLVQFIYRKIEYNYMCTYLFI